MKSGMSSNAVSPTTEYIMSSCGPEKTKHDKILAQFLRSLQMGDTKLKMLKSLDVLGMETEILRIPSMSVKSKHYHNNNSKVECFEGFLLTSAIEGLVTTESCDDKNSSMTAKHPH
jgi:hypothetical protein